MIRDGYDLILDNYLIDDKSLQPNAIDVRLAKLFDLTGSFILDNDGKTYHSLTAEVKPTKSYLALLAHTAYQFESNIKCSIPTGKCGWLIARSSLNRNGLIVVSGLYDSGFTGTIAGTIYNLSNQSALIQVNARIAQFIVADADTRNLYNGQYGEKIEETNKIRSGSI